MVSCGLADNSKEVECDGKFDGLPNSCEILDFWINGFNDKPLTWHQCGDPDKKLDKKDDKKCKPECSKDMIKKLKKMLEDKLKKYAKDPSKLSEDCIKELTKIDSVAYKGFLGELKNDNYCPDITVSQRCEDNAVTMATNITAMPSNVTANATTSAVTRKTAESVTILASPSIFTMSFTILASPSSVTKFAIHILFYAFFGAWVIIALLF